MKKDRMAKIWVERWHRPPKIEHVFLIYKNYKKNWNKIIGLEKFVQLFPFTEKQAMKLPEGKKIRITMQIQR